MTVVDDRFNSVVAAVLSASIVPIHGALAQEETPTAQSAASPMKAESASAEEATKPEDREAADK